MSEGDEPVTSELDRLGIDYEVIPCDPALADTAAFCAHYGYSLDDSANTIVVASRAEPKQYVACVVLASTRLDVNQVVRRRLGAGKVSFASSDETCAVTGMTIGGVTPVGLPPGLPIWVDARVMGRSRIILGGGSRTWKMLVSPGLFDRLPNVTVVPGLARGEPPGVG